MSKDKKTLSFDDPDILAEDFLVGYVFDGDTGTDPKRPLNLSTGQARYKLKRWQGEFYLWDAGRYIRLSDDEIKLRVKQFLHELNVLPEFADKQIKITTHLVTNILLCVGGMDGVFLTDTRPLNSWPENSEHKGKQTFVFNNMTAMLDEKQTEPLAIPHTPDYFTTVKLPYDYNPKATWLPLEDFLLNVMENDAERVILLQQWAGYLLTPNLRQQKFLLVSGEGSNGKGVFFELIEKMLGRENCSHIPLAAFGERFALASTLGKLVNLSCESSADITAYGENVLKSYTAGDSMSFARKYLDPIDAVPTAKVMLATNELPKIMDRSQGIWRRLIFVPFERVYTEKEQDKNLIDMLSMILPGVFNWAVKGIELLKEYNGFVSPEKCREALAEYQLKQNPARAYLQETYEFDREAEGMPCTKVYDDYTTWCASNGFRPLNSANFGKEVFRVYPEAEKMKKRDGDNRTALYKGLRRVEAPVTVGIGNSIP